MSVTLDWFYAQDKTMQTKLIAYSYIREQEDEELLSAQLTIGATRGL